MRLRFVKVAVAVAAAATAAAAVPALATSHAAARSRAAALTLPRSSHETQIAPGVIWRSIVAKGPNRVNVLSIDPGAAATLDTALAAGVTIPGYQRTSTLVANDGGIAGINGDFGIWPGRPAHLFSINGILVQTSLLGAMNLAENQDKTTSHVGKTSFSASAVDTASNVTIPITEWNVTSLRPDEVGAYTAYGGAVGPPPRDSCYARLLPSTKAFWAPNQDGVSRDYTVDTVACQSPPPALDGGLVLAAVPGTQDAKLIADLVPGDPVRAGWTPGWPDILDTLGGNPLLIANGQIMVGKCNTYLCVRNPRTVVGVTATGRILLVTVDGRWPGYSVGMTELRTARFMQRLGAVWALNLDGGGSTTMVINGKIVNRPSDGSERYVTNALVVLPGLDPKDPIMTIGSAAPAIAALASPMLPASYPVAPPGVARRAAAAALSDPGSTGGLLASAKTGPKHR